MSKEDCRVALLYLKVAAKPGHSSEDCIVS
jgi:hypothetical protein